MRRALVIGGLVAAGLVSFGLFVGFIARSGVTRVFDNQFGDQHLKTTVALVELHKVRYGTYPHALSDLRFTGDWDQIALQSVSYCVAADGQSYFVDVTRGWMGRPDLKPPPEFWQRTGFNAKIGPCR
jgi:hypothetical protein